MRMKMEMRTIIVAVPVSVRETTTINHTVSGLSELPLRKAISGMENAATANRLQPKRYVRSTPQFSTISG